MVLSGMTAMEPTGLNAGNSGTPLLWAFIRVVLQHLAQGFPLEFPEAVADIYLAGMPETPLFKCERCGYGQARTFTECVLCGGNTGELLYCKRMARGTQWN